MGSRRISSISKTSPRPSRVRQATSPVGRRREDDRRFAFGQRHEGLAGLAARQEILALAAEAVAAAGGDQIELRLLIARARQGLAPPTKSASEVAGNAVALAAGNVGGGDRIGASLGVEQDQVIDRAAGQAGEQAVAGTESQLGRVDVVAGARAQPAVFRDDQRGRFIDDGNRLGIRHGDLVGGFDEGAAVVAVFFGIGLDFGRDAGAQGFFGIEQLVEAGRFFAQLGQFLADLDAFQPRQLAQADFEDVFGLDLGQLEVR